MASVLPSVTAVNVKGNGQPQIFLIVKGQATICLKYDNQHKIVSYNANYAMIKFFAQNQSRLF